MFDGLLRTKLFVPSSRATLIPRPHLIEKLTNGQQRKLTLISAPAGYGKTTLISEWISNSERRFAWLSLDHNDRDPTRFLIYLIAAIQTIKHDFGQALAELLATSPSFSIDPLLTRLINEMSTIPEPFALVLDDYHVLDAKPIDDMLSFLLHHLPSNAHLIVTTREDPSFSLSRMRVRDELTEIRMADLQFSVEEAAQFLTQTMALTLSAAEIGQLEQRTEGWVAGLQMAAISMRGRSDTEGFVQAFTGSHRFIIDYLVEEVLDSQPKQVRRFLLQTSILDRCNASLCDAVTGLSQSQEVLTQLERRNMLIVPLDDQRQWYRYHHLFADVLQTYAGLELADQFSDLHRRASVWYEAENLWPEAIHHAQAAGDPKRLADLLECAWPIIPKGIKPQTWLNWAQDIPSEVVHHRPVLSAAFGWISLDIGDLSSAATYLDNVDEWLARSAKTHPSAAADMIVANIAQFDSLSGTTACARAYLARARGNLSDVVTYAQQALIQLADHEHYWRGNAGLLLGMAQASLGDLESATHSVLDSIASQKKAGNLYFQILGTVTLADILVDQGRLHDALSRYEDALQLAQTTTGRGQRVAPITINLYVGLGNLYREWGDLVRATQYLEYGHAVSEKAIMPLSEYPLYIARARVKAAEGDYTSAQDLLDQAEKLQNAAARSDRHPLPVLRAKLWLQEGKLADARGWAKRLSYTDVFKPITQHEFEHLTFARVAVSDYIDTKDKEQLQRAITMLGQLAQHAEAAGRIGSLIEISIVQALALNASGELAQAVTALQRGLELAEPAGYIRIFADEGASIRPLLVSAIAQGSDAAYITHLVSAIDQQSDHPNSQLTPNQLLREPLSNRELDVLHKLANGQTNQAIADDLFIALSTVKKHVNNIYGKLGVSNRTQAINRARELNMI